METRSCKISITKAGGHSSAGSEKHRVTLPTTWSKALGFTKEERNAIITFEGDKIIITKADVMKKEND